MKSQRGVALLAAVLVVALAATLMVGLLDSGESTRAHTRNLLRSEQAWQYARGLEFWAKEALYADAIDSAEIDGPGDAWLQPLPPLPVPGGELRGILRDASGCLNLNRLLREDGPDPVESARFTRLLELLNLDLAIGAQVLDWLDRDLIPETNGAEDLAYLQRNPPYRSGNRLFSGLSELRLLPAVDAKAFAKLHPHVCALPRTAYTNLNFASLMVWQSLDPGITEGLAKQLSREGDARWSNIDAVRQALTNDLGIPNVRLDGLGTDSRYVRLDAQITLDGLPFVETSLLERGINGIRVLARFRGRG